MIGKVLPVRGVAFGQHRDLLIAEAANVARYGPERFVVGWDGGLKRRMSLGGLRKPTGIDGRGGPGNDLKSHAGDIAARLTPRVQHKAQ